MVGLQIELVNMILKLLLFSVFMFMMTFCSKNYQFLNSYCAITLENGECILVS